MRKKLMKNTNTNWKAATIGNIIVSDKGEVAKVNEDGTYTEVPLHIHKGGKQSGYCQYYVAYVNGFRLSVHRLVAVAFIPNPDNKPFVHHIDGDSLNNDVSNLMWVTGEEHRALHAKARGRVVGNQIKWNWELHPTIRPHRSVRFYNGVEMLYFNSLRDAARCAGLSTRPIARRIDMYAPMLAKMSADDIYIEYKGTPLFDGVWMDGVTAKGAEPVTAINLVTKRRKTYKSHRAAAIALGVSQGNIVRCVKYPKGHPYHLNCTGGYRFVPATRKGVA